MSDELSAFESFLTPEAVDAALLEADFDMAELLKILATIAKDPEESTKCRIVAATQLRQIVIETAEANRPDMQLLEATVSVTPVLPANNSSKMLEESNERPETAEDYTEVEDPNRDPGVESSHFEEAERRQGGRSTRWRPPEDPADQPVQGP